MSFPDALIQILMGGLGTLGFNILFNIRGKKLLLATLGGVISWTVFLALAPVLPGEALRYFLSAAVITVYGEILARIEKTPTTTFLVPSIVPLIPGIALTNSLRDMISGDIMTGMLRFFDAVLGAAAIAAGYILAAQVLGGVL